MQWAVPSSRPWGGPRISAGAVWPRTEPTQQATHLLRTGPHLKQCSKEQIHSRSVPDPTGLPQSHRWNLSAPSVGTLLPQCGLSWFSQDLGSQTGIQLERVPPPTWFMLEYASEVLFTEACRALPAHRGFAESHLQLRGASKGLSSPGNALPPCDG